MTVEARQPAGKAPVAVTAPDPAGPVLVARGVRLMVSSPRRGRRSPELRGVDGLTLDVHPGDVVWLAGGPGSGVAEVTSILGGVVAPDAGRLLVEGVDLSAQGRRGAQRWQRRVVTLDLRGAHGPRTVTPVQLVGADLRLDPGPGRPTRIPRRAQRGRRLARAAELLGAFGIPDEVARTRMGKVPSDLWWRVEMARIVGLRPAAVVVPDVERLVPDGADPDLVWGLLEELRAEGSALVLGTARPPREIGPGDRVLVLCGGRVIEQLGIDELDRPLHPFTRVLVAQGMTTPPAEARDPGCPFRGQCLRAQGRCSTSMPELTPPMGASHPVACWFPDPAEASPAMGGARTASGAADVDLRGGYVDEPTAREFAQG